MTKAELIQWIKDQRTEWLGYEPDSNYRIGMDNGGELIQEKIETEFNPLELDPAEEAMIRAMREQKIAVVPLVQWGFAWMKLGAQTQRAHDLEDLSRRMQIVADKTQKAYESQAEISTYLRES